MSGSKSKLKGSGAERELCKILMEIFGGSFIRADGSGAFVGGKNRFRKANLSENQLRSKKSDVVPPDHMKNLVLESKFYSDFPFHQLMKPGNVPVLDDWIKQTLDVIDEQDEWFVAFKINRRGWFIVVPHDIDYEYGNHCVYEGKYGKFRITDMMKFFTSNKEKVLLRSA